MTVLNYAYHANPTDHHDVLSKFRTFAETTCSWTVDYYYNNNIQWGATGGSPPYGWISGSESHLGLYSNGYGKQNIVARVRCEAAGTDAQHEWMHCSGISPYYRTVDTNSSTQPPDQNAFTYSGIRKLSVSPGTWDAVWFFGNEYVLIMVCAIDTTFVQMAFIGVPELIAGGDKGCWSVCCGQKTVVPYKWYQAWSHTGDYFLPWENVQTVRTWNNQTRAGVNNLHTNITADDTGAYFNVLTKAIKENTWTGKRTLIKYMNYLHQPGDTYYPVGTWPIFGVKFTGLTIGQQLDYSTEEYLCFPPVFPSLYENGFAIRIT